MYWAIIGDLIASRRIAGRDRLQSRLEVLLGALNERFGDALAAQWVITIGDEFQGLAKSPEPLPAMVDFLANELHPRGVRFGVGFGALTTDLKPVAIGMDGPAFHAARLALEVARESRRRIVAASNGRVLPLPTHIWDLTLKVTLARTPTQRRAVQLYRELGRQQDVAASLGIGQGAISKLLTRALHAEVEAVLADLPRLLERAARGDIP